MCRRKVFATAKNIYDIDVDFFKSIGIKNILIDLDNTLDSYKLFHPTKPTIDLISKLKKTYFIAIVSNNHGKRVKTYAKDLDVPCIANAKKPFARHMNKFIAENHLIKDETVLIGDQMITDVGAANRVGIKVILTEKLVKEDQWTTRINRIFGRRIKKHQLKKGLLKDWRTFYGKA